VITAATGKVLMRLSNKPARLSIEGNKLSRRVRVNSPAGSHQSDSGEPVSQSFGSRHAARIQINTGRSSGGKIEAR